MPLQLTPEQIRRLVERAAVGTGDADDGGAGDDAYALADGSSSGPYEPMRKRRHTAYLLFLEGSDPKPDTPMSKRVLDYLVQNLQPEPALTHVELFIPPGSPAHDTHFSTYLGMRANWGRQFKGGADFYLAENRTLWSAVPVMALDAADRMRLECEAHVNTPYGDFWPSLYRYPLATPPFRAFSGWVGDTTRRSQAHCASLTARCLRCGLPELGLPHASAWYGPTTLYLELTRRERFEQYAAQRAELQTLRTLPDEEGVVDAANTLVWGADASVAELNEEVCAEAVELLCDRVVEAGCCLDERKQHEAQKHLGLALVRWSQLLREPSWKAAARADALSEADTERAGDSSGSEEAAEWAPMTLGADKPLRRRAGGGGGAGGGSSLAWSRS